MTITDNEVTEKFLNKPEEDWMRPVADSLMEKFGFTVNKNRERALCQILRERAGCGSYPGVEDYCHKLLRDDAGQEWQIIIDQLTVKETYFFRNFYQFQFLENQLLPGLMKKKWRWAEGDQPRVKPSIRILSAGCSTGEEPYSIAISANETIRYLKSWNLTIDAIDVSPTAVEQARKGIFQDNERFAKSVNDMNETYLEKYFESSGAQWKLKDEIRSLVNFRVVNIKSMFHAMPVLLPKYDAIFCRNVMIYFNYADQCALVRLIVNMLEPGGCVFMGDAEVLHIYNHDLELVNANRGLIYRKNGR